MADRIVQIPPSTNLAQVVYDEETRQLTITFLKGEYIYYDVPSNVALGFETSRVSAGAYFRGNILNQFRFDRLA